MIDMLIKILKNNNINLETSMSQDWIDNNRKYDRFPIGDGIYALLSWKKMDNQILLGHLIDINRNGCALCYVSSRSNAEKIQSQKNCKLKLVSAFDVIELKENTVVYDHELIQYSTAKISVRRCGIQFKSAEVV